MNEKRMKKINFVYLGVFVLALIGIGDTVYLIGKQLAGEVIGSCPVFGTGCGDVLTSKYSEFLGIPLSVYGFVFYSGMALFSLFLLFKKNEIVRHLLMLGGIVGFLLSVSFIYIMGVLIGAYCFYCVISATTSTLIFFTLLPSIINRILDLTQSPPRLNQIEKE